MPQVSRLWRPGFTARSSAILLSALLFALPVPAQNQPAAASFSVHGLVLNAATGQPLPRALVLANGQSGAGVLTDGDGRFQIDGLSAGPNVFEISRPGFVDAAGASSSLPLRNLRGYTHNVYVSADTPELAFSLRPTNTIHGHVDLSTGDPAQGIRITLLAAEIQDGRMIWRPRNSTRVSADGNYRFAHLADGDYAVLSQPASATGEITLPAASANRLSASGYPQTYFPDSATFTGASHIHVSGGEQVQANLSLNLRTFHLVRAFVLLPPQFRGENTPSMIQVEVTTADSTRAPYPAEFDRKTSTVRAMLPDGAYTITVNAMQPNRIAGSGATFSLRGGQQGPHPLTGSAAITVAGHPITNLRIPIGADLPNPLQVNVTRTSTSEPPHGSQVFVYLSQAASLTDGMQAQYAQGAVPGALDTMAPSPGRYWLHTVTADPTLCEASLTAGGANLGAEPLTVGPGGSTAPLTLSLRDDCASLRLNLPASAATLTTGQETAYTVYVVPDFPFTGMAGRGITIRPTNGGTFRLDRLTPGAYHVYTFAAPVDLEYHNRRLLASLPGQPITLDPGATADLTLEVPAP